MRGSSLGGELGRPLVKVCGMTRVPDAALAAELGADAIGVVFWERSPRAVTPDRARAIARALSPSVWLIGVFVNADPEVIAHVAREVPLSAVQLHGDERPDVLARLPVPVLKALAPQAPGAWARAAGWPLEVTLVLDVHDPERRGGTGRLVDWQVAARWARDRRVLLSGGLHAGNVAEALARVSPYGVDVSSGVESAPGQKDEARLRAFFAAVNAANETRAGHDGRRG